MDSREFTNFIREKAEESKIGPVALETAVGEILTTTLKERIKNKNPIEQLMDIVILLATIMSCFNVSPKMFRDEHFLKALEKATKMLEDIELPK